MASSGTQKVLIGCGIGCGVILLGMVTLFIISAVFVRDTTEGFKGAIETRKVIDETFGEPGEFVPRPDGSVAPERMEAFLAVRDATQPARDEIVAFFGQVPLTEAEARELEDKPTLEKMGSIFKLVTSAFGLGKGIGNLMEARNSALIEAEIGMGEYSYIYTLAYYAWLGHSPDDGPGDDRSEGDDPVLGDMRIESNLHDHLLQMLHNQLAVLPKAEDGAAADEWRAELGAEIERLESDSSALPWQHGLPSAIAGSFEPFRERLEPTYGAASNPFELSRNKQSGKFSFTTE